MRNGHIPYNIFIKMEYYHNRSSTLSKISCRFSPTQILEWHQNQLKTPSRSFGFSEKVIIRFNIREPSWAYKKECPVAVAGG